MNINENTRWFCADLEANGLLEKEGDKEAATRIWCLSFCDVKDKIIKSVTDIKIIKKFFEQENAAVIMHYGVMYDIPLIEKLLNFKVKIQIIDTLPLSQTLFPQRADHNLENWGNTLGIVKLPIIEWNDEKLLPQYVLRCESDIKIQVGLWEQIIWMLDNLYTTEEDKWKYVFYTTWMFQCVRKQQELGLKLDIPLVKETLIELEDLKLSKIELLSNVMPKVPIKSKKSYPKVFKKANGELSENGKKWVELIKENNLPEGHISDIEVITGYKTPNPNSHDQLKDWLYTMGWIPANIKHVRDKKKNEVRKIPQLKSKIDDGELCESVIKLIEKQPELEELNGYFKISHRIGVLKGLLRDVKQNGKIYQGCSSFTNTLRWQHSVLVNLISVDKQYSKGIRESLIASDDKHILIGADITSLEDSCKQHFIFPLDPDYVREQMSEGYDPHLSVAQFAGMLTAEQVENHKKGIENHKVIRSKAKQVNFSCVYGVAKKTLSINLGCSEKEAQTFIDAYWKRNWAVKEISETFKTKQIGTQSWIQSPISGFWLSLRAEKDRFSSVNQNAGVTVFNLWVKNMQELGVNVYLQMHDEIVTEVLKEDEQKTKDLIQKAMDMVNEELKLNVTIKCSIASGVNYGNIH